ncbi:MAG: HAD-IB family hydrolase [Hyphomonadaceae bacterium]|nr:HAD-IB family hydrolase [Hyphomonadaceae bacterium]
MLDDKNTKPIQMIAFDFDGTITTTDTLKIFFRYHAGNLKWTLVILKLLPVFIGYVLKMVPRDTVKAKLVQSFLTGVDAKEFQVKADQYAKDIIPGLIRPNALKALIEKNNGPDSVYIVSASLSAYILPWAKGHGITNVIATDLEIKNGRLTGRLDGANCWGPGKMVKIDARMGKGAYVLKEAYGDTRGDREMLHAAQESFFKPFHQKQ